jgi:hypothetical protein
MKRTLIMLVVIIAAVQTVKAFDGKRDQWVIGGGIGYAPAAKYEVGTLAETKRGPAFQFLLGPALTERDLLVLDINICFIPSDRYIRYFYLEKTASKRQGYIGLDWFHYYGTYASSVFTTFGFGGSYFKIAGEKHNKPEVAFQFGTGYAFGRGHAHIGAYIAVGSSSKDNIGFDHTQLTALLTLIGF